MNNVKTFFENFKKTEGVALFVTRKNWYDDGSIIIAAMHLYDCYFSRNLGPVHLVRPP